MRSIKKGAYMGLGWTTWRVGKRVVRRKLRGQLKRGATIGAGLLIVAIVGALIAGRNGS